MTLDRRILAVVLVASLGTLLTACQRESTTERSTTVTQPPSQAQSTTPPASSSREHDQYDDDRFGATGSERQYVFEHDVFEHNRNVSASEQVEDRNDDDDHEGKEPELTPAACRGSTWKVRGGRSIARRARKVAA